MRGYGCFDAGSDAAFRPHAKIIVKQYRTLNIYTKSHFYACGDMWDGIEAENGLFVRVTGRRLSGRYSPPSPVLLGVRGFFSMFYAYIL